MATKFAAVIEIDLHSLVVEDYSGSQNLISQETQKSWMHFLQLLRVHLLQKYPEQMCIRAQWPAHRCDYSKSPIQRICVTNKIVFFLSFSSSIQSKYNSTFLTCNRLEDIGDKFQLSFFPSIDVRLSMYCEMSWWSNAIVDAPYRRINLIYLAPLLDYLLTSDTCKQNNQMGWFLSSYPEHNNIPITITTYRKNPSELNWPFCELNLFGSYWHMISLARVGFAYGCKISFNLGSRWVLFKNSTNCAVDIRHRFDVPTLSKWSMKWKMVGICDQKINRVFATFATRNAQALTILRKSFRLRFSALDSCTNWKSLRIEI